MSQMKYQIDINDWAYFVNVDILKGTRDPRPLACDRTAGS